MPRGTMTRPGLTARYYAWKNHGRADLPGIALWGMGGLTAHLTPAEARKLADKLHDMADRLDAAREPQKDK